MPGVRTAQRDQPRRSDIFADWVASDDHFFTGVPASANLRVTRRPVPSTPALRPSPAYSHDDQQVSSAQNQGVLPRSFSDAGTQTEVVAAAVSARLEPLPGGEPPSASPSAESPAFNVTPSEPAASPDPPASASDEVTLPSQELAAASPEPVNPSEGSANSSATAASGAAAPVTPEAEPPSAPLGPSAAALLPSRNRPSERGLRTRSHVGRDSYQLLWREYLALTEQQQRQQQAAARRGLFGRSSSSRSNATAAVTDTEMSSPAPSTILLGPLAYDKPKGLGALLLPLLCPPTDFIDMQKLTKLLIGLVVGVATWLVTLSFAVIPAWLWLLRHELLQGHKGDVVALLVAGLLVFVVADAVRGAAVRADGARRAGVFMASDKSAYQLSLGRQGFTGAPGGAAKLVAATAAVRAAGQPVAVPGGARTPSAAARSHPSPMANGVDPVVGQVKQRIIKLERILFGNELTEADISPDALSGRVQMLCKEVGLHFEATGGSTTRSTAADLNQQLQAVEKALGVM